MRFELIPLEAVHAGLASAIHRQCFPEPWGPADMAEMIGMAGSFGWIAGLGHPVGLIICRIAADEAEVVTLAVLPPMRGRGVAGRLMAAAMARAREAGARFMFLEVAQDNAAALAVYRRLGFAEVGRRPRYYSDGRDALVMRAALADRAAVSACGSAGGAPR